MFTCTSAHQDKASLFIRPQNHIRVASVGSGKNILNILCPQILNLCEQKVAGLKKNLLEAKNKMEDTSGERDPSLRTDRQTLDVACTEQQHHGLQIYNIIQSKRCYIICEECGSRRKAEQAWKTTRDNEQNDQQRIFPRVLRYEPEPEQSEFLLLTHEVVAACSKKKQK